MASDRLAELQRQRTLAQAQLAWFDQEIARELSQTVATPTSPQIAAAPEPLPDAPVTLLDAPEPAASNVAVLTPDELVAQFPQNATSSAESVRRGCFITFAIVMGTLVLGTLAVYLVYQARR